MAQSKSELELKTSCPSSTCARCWSRTSATRSSAPRSRSPWKISRKPATWAVRPYPFGIAGGSFENPVYLDKLVDTRGGESIPDYEKKVQCCGGALRIVESEKSQEMIKGIIEAAYDHGADRQS